VSQSDPPPTDPYKDVAQARIAQAAGAAVASQGRIAFRRLVESITPWLVEVGNWIFAGLIAFIVLVLAPLLTAGSVDRALTVATVTFALALPMALAGLVLLRLARDTGHIGFAEEWAQALQDAGLPIGGQIASADGLESLRKRQTNVILVFSFALLVLSGLLTLTGLVAAFWHMAWWIGVLFLAMVIISLGIVSAALVALRPAQSPEDKERYMRYWEEMVRRAQAQSTTDKGP
jgi:hypothetical protein